MKICFVFLALAGLLAAGCGNGPGDSTSVTNAPAASTPATAAGDYAGAMARSQQLAVKTIDTAAFNSAIQLFQVDKGRLPKDLNELVQEKFLPKIPATPPGTPLDYDAATGRVRVVNQ